MYHFGSGNLYGLVKSGSIYVPRKFGTVQDVSVDFQFEMKELYGQNQFPVDQARGKGKITGKAKFASLTGGLINDILFGQTLTTGETLAVFGEAGTVPAATPFTVTVANATKFVDDLGVVYAATGQAMTRVASAPTTGQYSVSAGVYTFAAGDANAAVLIDYTYTSSTTGATISLNNQLLGTTPSFQLLFPMQYQGKQLSVKFNRAFSGKIALATKLDDYMVPEFDFTCVADSTGAIGTIGIGDA